MASRVVRRVLAPALLRAGSFVSGTAVAALAVLAGNRTPRYSLMVSVLRLDYI